MTSGLRSVRRPRPWLVTGRIARTSEEPPLLKVQTVTGTSPRRQAQHVNAVLPNHRQRPNHQLAPTRTGPFLPIGPPPIQSVSPARPGRLRPTWLIESLPSQRHDEKSRAKRLDQFRSHDQPLVRQKQFDVTRHTRVRRQTGSLHQCASGPIVHGTEPALKVP